MKGAYVRVRVAKCLLVLAIVLAAGAGALAFAARATRAARTDVLARSSVPALARAETPAPAGTPAPFEGPVPRASCGPGSLPETGLQGEVTMADRQGGRSKLGYRCNLQLLGRYQGGGASWVDPSYGHCAYMASHYVGPPSPTAKTTGVQVVDVSDPRHPRLTENLTSPAMVGTWESLKVNEQRGLLAGVFSPGGVGDGFFDVYDVKQDCAHPRLLASISATALLKQLPGAVLTSIPKAISAALLFGHEGNWSPDGRTYWASGSTTGTINAIDVSDPADPSIVFTGRTGIINHGFGISPDGDRLYMAEVGNTAEIATGAGLGDTNVEPNGLKIFDVSQIQDRRPNPQIQEVGHVYWTDGAVGQMAAPVTYTGKPYVIFADELGYGSARIIDVSNKHYPRVVAKLKLEIQMPQRAGARSADVGSTDVFGYNAHYCTPDRGADPTALACGYFESGVRVFDIRDPYHPREIAYYNPPAQTGDAARLPNSEHPGFGALTTDWCSSPPRFVSDELWVTCQDNGFMALQFTNHAYPLPSVSTVARCARPTGRLVGTALGRVSLGELRGRARATFVHFRLWNRAAFDIGCLRSGPGIRVGYPSSKLLQSLPRRERPGAASRAILILTANPFYALDGVRPGTRLSVAARRLHLTKGFSLGLNLWYFVPARVSNGVFKVRHGVIKEIGIANKRLTSGGAAKRRFLRSFY